MRDLVGRLKAAFEEEKEYNPSWFFYKSDNEYKENENPLKNLPFLSEDNSRVTLEDYLMKTWENGKMHLMISGIGGVGKTIALFEAASQISIPVIYIPLSYFSNDDMSQNLIIKYIQNITLSDDEQMFKELVALCKKRWDDAPHIILILDGANELVESKQSEIAKEINKLNREYAGLQMIVSSRYNFGINLRMRRNAQYRILKMEELTRKEIEAYLKYKRCKIPEETDKLWNIIDTPLMLNLYAKVKLWKEEEGSIAIFYETHLNAGRIIWNYLQSEIERYQKEHNSEKARICAVSLCMVAPYIAFYMVRNNIFYISPEDFNKCVGSMCKCYIERVNAQSNSKKLSSYMENLISTGDIENLEKLESNVKIMLQKETVIFYSSGQTLRFMHQNFRDCLAAIYLINVAESCEKDFPKEWEQPMSRYVKEFTVNLLQRDIEEKFQNSIWNKLWRLSVYSNNFDQVAETLLDIYKKIYGRDLSQVDFSKMNLKNVSLLGCKLSNNINENFLGAKICYSTMSGRGHSMDVVFVGWANDSNSFISASRDGTIRIWNDKKLDEPVVLNQVAGLTHYVRCADYINSEEEKIISGGDDKKIVCWTYDKKETQWDPYIIGETKDWIHALAWSPDGKKIACGDRSGNLKLFYLDQDKSYDKIVHIHSSFIRNIAWPKLKKALLATGSDDGTVCLLSDEDQCIKKHLLLAGRQIKELSWICEDKYLFIVDARAFYIVNVQELFSINDINVSVLEYDNILEYQSPVQEKIFAAAIHKKGMKHYLAIFYERRLKISSIFKEEHSWSFESIDSVELDNTIVKSAQWDKECGKILCGNSNGALQQIAVLSDETENDRVEIEKIVQGDGKSVRCSAWSKDGIRIAAGYDDCSIRIWNVFKKCCVAVLEGHSESVKCICWSPNDNILLASGSDDGCIKIWDVNVEKCKLTKQFSDCGINAVIWLKNNMVLCGSDDSNVYLWDLNDDSVFRLSNHTKRIYGLAVSKDEDLCVSVGNDMTICLWDLKTRKCLDKINSGHSEPIRGISWLDNKNAVVTCSNDGLIIYREVDIKNKKFKKIYHKWEKNHEDYIYSIALMNNGKYIVGGSTDTDLSFWDIETEKCLGKGVNHTGFIWNISASPEINEKYYAASSSNDGIICIWDVTELQTGTAINPYARLEVIPGINFVGCNFSGGDFEDEKLKKKIVMNGGIINYTSKYKSLKKRSEVAMNLKEKNCVLVVTANPAETAAVLNDKTFQYESDQQSDDPNDPMFYNIGSYGCYHVIHFELMEEGSVGSDASQLAIATAINAFHPIAVILVGIAFGKDFSDSINPGQKIGDVLVSDMVADYESGKIKDGTLQSDGFKAESGRKLLSAFKNFSRTWKHEINGIAAKTEFGLILSGDKVVDDRDFKMSLLKQYPRMIGGEMEGRGAYSACRNRGMDEWIIVKGICDWADGTKSEDKKERQRVGAEAAVSLMSYVFSHENALKKIESKPTKGS